MTNWIPDLTTGTGPIYLRLADRIEQGISEGRLPAGDKLPPQRDLAYDLGVTVGTIGRAYALVRERGLVSGEVGRGTYVLPGHGPQRHDAGAMADIGRQAHVSEPSASTVAHGGAQGGTRTILPPPGMIRMDSTAAPDIGQSAIIARVADKIGRESGHEVASYTRTLPASWLEAGRRWLTTAGWSPAADTVIPTIGAHSAILSVIAAMTAPGDFIAFESLTYSSISRSANLIGRRTCVVEHDGEGAVPDDFERLCAQVHPKAIFLMPAMHNPTLAVMSAGRRKAIAEIAKRHNVWVIEDAIYGSLQPATDDPIVALAPERTFFVGGLSKSVAAGVRGGWLSAPAPYVQRIMTAHKMLTGGIPFLLSELAAQLVLNGAADDIRRAVIEEVAGRQAIAVKAFAGFDFVSAPHTPYVWMKLADPWLSGPFKSAAANEGVLVDDEDEFKPGRTERTHHRVRIGFSTPHTRDEVRAGFDILRRLMLNAGASYDSYE